ncbi:Flagellar basal body rod protein FlgB [bacterium HR29]|jgi:flagellar basal-body rod protein FlgB|nr:Flagellar basal body rod protein FlgB [bacterium HR29]
MRIFGDRAFETISAWLDGLAQRRQAIADNIANIDTPGYQRKVVDFEAALQRELGTARQTLAVTDPRHIATPPSAGGLSLQAAQRLASSRLDANTVDIDQEMVLLFETQARYQAAATAISHKFAQLRNVIRGA